MYDAMGVRRSTGEQAKLLNKIIVQLHFSEKAENEIKERLNRLTEPEERMDPVSNDAETHLQQIKEKLGHTPLEVLAGALLGILVAMLMPV